MCFKRNENRSQKEKTDRFSENLPDLVLNNAHKPDVGKGTVLIFQN